MIAELFRIGPLAVSPFGVMLVLAFFAAYAQLRWGMRRLGIGDEDDANALLVAAALGGLIGGKVYYAALYADWRLLFSRAGIVFYGSLILGGVAVAWVIHRRRLAFWSVADAVAPSVAVGYALGRIGCLLVGDDYGVPTDLPWGMTFPEGPIPTTVSDLVRNFDVELPSELAAGDLVAVHPTQAYESLAAVAIWWLGRSLLRRGAAPGTAALWVFGLLAAERFLVEFIRAKDDRLLGPLTVAQGISLAVVVVVVLFALSRRQVGRTGEDAPSPS